MIRKPRLTVTIHHNRIVFFFETPYLESEDSTRMFLQDDVVRTNGDPGHYVRLCARRGTYFTPVANNQQYLVDLIAIAPKLNFRIFRTRKK